MRANSEIPDRKKILLILQWCEDKFGKSEHWKKPLKLRVYKSKGKYMDKYNERGWRGGYYKGRILLFLGTINNIKELCETVIHEYHHYLMNDKEHKEFTKYLKAVSDNDEYIYNHHPHEKFALYAENKWGKICFNELRNKLYKKN